MRILIYALNFSPELSGAGKYTGELARALARRGCVVRIVTTPPYYPGWRVGTGYSAWRYQQESSGGIEIIRCPLWVPRQASGVKRIVHLLSFAFSSFPVVIRESLCWNPDAIVSVAPAIFTAPGALLAARLSGSAALLHVQDFEIEAAFKLGLVRHNGLRRVALSLEESLFRMFDRVTTISQRMLERLWQKGVAGERASLFINGVNLREIRPLEPRHDWREGHDISRDAFVVLYSGSIGEKQGLELLIDAARTLENDRSIVFLICGDGSAKARLVQQAAGLAAIRFLPLQPAEELNAMLNAADLHVLPQLAQAEDLVMPSKLGPILASGGAVVATARPDTELAQVVAAAGGMVIAPGDARSLASAIQTLKADPQRLERARTAARAYAERHLNDENSFDRYFRTVIEAVSRGRASLPKDDAVAPVQS